MLDPVDGPIPLRKPVETIDPGSFRDPSGHVFYRDGRVFRRIEPAAAAQVRATIESSWFRSLVARGMLVETRVIDDREASAVIAQPADGALLLEHARVPFTTHPYEWPFEMLRAAALQQLELMSEALDHNHTLKDGTPYNTQFRGVAPTFIDVTSLEPRAPGAPWAGYAQFCRLFLNPLLLQAKTGVAFQPWLRGAISGITPEDMTRLLPLRRRVLPPLLLHVTAQAWLNRRAAKRDAGSTRLPSVSDDALRRLVSGLTKTVERLARPEGQRSHWLDYESQCHYEDAAAAAKRRIVDRVLSDARPHVAWDLGCNLGEYSLIAARYAERVIAIDGDEPSVGGVYERMRRENVANVLPIAVDLANPSPDQGWQGLERRGLLARGPADLVLCLALMHHLVITENVPLPRFADWLASLTSGLAIVEYVPPSDPMARRLLHTRDGALRAYDEEAFRAALGHHFDVEAVEPLPASDRVLYVLRRR